MISRLSLIKLFIASCLILAVQVTHASENVHIKLLNEKIENFVAEKQLSEAIRICNEAFYNAKSEHEKKFLMMSKMRLFVKSGSHLDSIPLLFKKATSIKTKKDSLGCFIEARLLEIYGHYFFKSKETDLSLVQLKKADSIYANCQNADYRIYNLNMIGNIYKSLNNYADALYHLLLANQLIIENTTIDTETQASVFNDLGVVYLKLNQYGKALAYFNKIDLINLNTLRQAHAYNNLGICHLNLGNAQLCIDNLVKAAENYLANNRQLEYATALNNLGSVIEDTNPDSALSYYFKSLDIKLSFGDSAAAVSSLLNISNLYYKLNNTKKCGEWIKQLEYFTHHFDYADIASYHQIKAYYYKASGEYQKAYHHHVLYHQYTDTINEKRNTLQLIRAETEFNTEQQRIKIISLEKEQKITALNEQKRNAQLENLTIISVFSGLLLVVLLFYFYRKQQYQKNLRLSEVQLASYASLLKGQEGERARLAKELHDSVGNNLSFIKSETLRLAHDNVYLISLISQTAEDVRSITHNLMPTVIRKFGLVQGLKDLVDKWQRNSTVLVDLNVDNNIKRYDENIELAIFRIVQELTSNAIKHGESNYILIEIKTKPDGLHMLFEDNGNGFDVENATQSGGLGFQNINNRVAFLNGDMSASSTSSGSKFLFLFKVFPL